MHPAPRVTFPAGGASRRVVLAAVLVSGLIGACARDPTAPVASAAASDGFMPLAPGDRWTYRHERITRFLAPNGSEVRDPIAFDGESRRAIVAMERIAGTDYAVLEETFFVTGSLDTAVAWHRYREDETGLYRADLPDTWPPGGATGVDSLTETRELAYPLRVGATWELHAGSPAAIATIECEETVPFPGDERRAFRVSLRTPGMRPSDARLFWYSPCGLLARRVHAELTAMDTGTGEVIHIVSDERVDTVDLHARCARPGSSWHRDGSAGTASAPDAMDYMFFLQ
jgi:hypothetical protein